MSGLGCEILRLLTKKAMTRPELSEPLDSAFIGSSLMGHLDKAKLEPGSLLARGLVTVAVKDGTARYSITAAGRKVAVATSKTK